MSQQRTAKDEANYNAGRRREEPIKTEVIAELREQNKQLWQTQVTLLDNLLRDAEAIFIYRSRALASAKANAESSSSCIPGCTRHTWDSKDGWHRKEIR